MWWSGYWPMPWMLFGPVTMVLFIALCVLGVVFVMRMMHRQATYMGSGSGSVMGCCGFGALDHDDVASQSGDQGHSAFAEYRAETLQRLENEQREFQQFVGRLRVAKDKAEFDQFMAERRGEH